MTPIIHTTRPPATAALIVRFSADLAQQGQDSAWTGARSCVSVLSGIAAQSPAMSWGKWVMGWVSKLAWWITPDTTDDQPWVWCYVTDLPAILESLLNPQAPAAGPDLAPELEATRAELARVRAAIAQFVEAAK